MYFKEADQDDYNGKIYKLHESLKNKRDEIMMTKDVLLIEVYNEILNLIYEILINNNVTWQFLN